MIAVLGEGGDWVEFADAGSGRYRCGRLEADRLTACLFVDAAPRLPDRAWLASLFSGKALEDSDRASLLAARPQDPSAVTGPPVCACFGVGRDALIRAIASGTATTVKAIGQTLRAGTNCGSCIPELNEILEESLEKNNELPPEATTPAASAVTQ